MALGRVEARRKLPNNEGLRPAYGPSFGLCYIRLMAEWTGLEPATPGVTGRYSNQLNYHSGIRTARNCLLVGAERLELPTFAL